LRDLPQNEYIKICTGQVVITLSGACKELIDNSLDAGAKTIEVRLKKMGFESIEVIDDGYGIHSINFDSLCKPHATSKLSNFSDFNQLTTFGFRGEALSSLCAVSSVTITTRHTNEVMATKLQFDHDASIKLQEKCARPVNFSELSTVIINLFETLPVRRKEFERSLKKAFAKLLITVQSFCLSHTDVRFVLNSLTDGYVYNSLVTPGGNASVKDVLVNLFGLRFEKDSVLDIIQYASIQKIYSLICSTKIKNVSHAIVISLSSNFFIQIFGSLFKISGYVSSCVHGQGRSTADRQFIYFNKRPVDYAKLCRIANEVYQLYNRGQYCMLILFVDVPAETMDVNVAPDKRSVFFVHEKELFALLRASLIATFTPYLGLIGTSSSSLRTESLLRIGSLFVEDFQSMQIVGQFNKGFIIARLHNNLFIIDQHASDEKYNFERFQKKARIQTQHLISPRILDLGVIKEAILRDNIDIFKYNGFEFRFDDDVVGKRALLTAIPVLHSWQFSISDIDEMLSVLCDFPGIIYRPVKLQKIFASRACRKSVMIGSSLTFPQMEKVCCFYNCPHGRPTLRHLCALKTKISRSNLKS
uniref:DNA_mis_repair domain-containing protein n=1 Tax=Thelazia callipaeda TaxID=103827 RepID=A0A0N5CJ22_THECL